MVILKYYHTYCKINDNQSFHEEWKVLNSDDWQLTDCCQNKKKMPVSVLLKLSI